MRNVIEMQEIEITTNLYFSKRSLLRSVQQNR